MFEKLLFVFFVIILSGCLQEQGKKNFEVVEKAVAARAVDGDTILLKNGERVRLIGINAPEKGERCWEEAKNRLQELVFGRGILLVKDVSNRDKYSRLVRYVYVKGKLVNLALVEQGYAFAFEFEPDTSLAVLFKEAEAMAVDGNGCLWKMKS